MGREQRRGARIGAHSQPGLQSGVGRPVEGDGPVLLGFGLFAIEHVPDLEMLHRIDIERDQLLGAKGGINAQRKQRQVARLIGEQLFDPPDRHALADRLDLDG